jgi:hypothetical protein
VGKCALQPNALSQNKLPKKTEEKRGKKRIEKKKEKKISRDTNRIGFVFSPFT